MPSGGDLSALSAFFERDLDQPMLGLVYGRRRIGKTTLLAHECDARDGFYYEATRVETPMQLARLGSALAAHRGIDGRLALRDWDDAVDALLALASDGAVPIVLDEFGHVLEADPSVPSVISVALGPASSSPRGSARLVLCGSAIAMMRSLTAGEAPLRGRASLELVMQPDDFRTAAIRLPTSDLALAQRVYSFIGGVVGYGTDMVAHDLPGSLDDLDRWVCERVLAPSSPLHHEATTLLAEDPSVGGRSASVHHAVLGAIANGAVTFGTISRAIGRSTGNLAPFVNRLVDAGFVTRLEDPVRDQRTRYALADPYLQVHYAVIDPHRARLRLRNVAQEWEARLSNVHASAVRGPVFEQQARDWVERFADDATIGGAADHVGPSSVSVDGVDHDVDVVAAAGTGPPAGRSILAIGEAKAGEVVTERHVRRLELLRAAYGPRAAAAKLLLFGSRFNLDVDGRADVEIIDLERLYTGS